MAVGSKSPDHSDVDLRRAESLAGSPWREYSISRAMRSCKRACFRIYRRSVSIQGQFGRLEQYRRARICAIWEFPPSSRLIAKLARARAIGRYFGPSKLIAAISGLPFPRGVSRSEISSITASRAFLNRAFLVEFEMVRIGPLFQKHTKPQYSFYLRFPDSVNILLVSIGESRADIPD